ncbi:MAG TPA: anti-sigma factor [Nocardioides sp.]|nr:anti-sigma factor [Nocardioides sp.]
MSDIHALSGAYAIDALDDVERARFERHLAECADCTAEVASLREAAALLPETTMARPPAALRDRVLADIDAVRPLPPVVTTAPDSGDRRPRRRLLALVAAAAALVAIGAVGATVWHPWSDESSQAPSQTAAERIRAADDAESWTERFDDGSSVTITRSAELNGAIVETHDMAPAGADKVYQLWLQHDDRMVSAGLMPEGPDNTVVLEGDPATADGFGITREPAGGSDEPTQPPVALVDFEEA